MSSPDLNLVKTYCVYGVGPFGPTNFTSQRQSVGRLRVVRGGVLASIACAIVTSILVSVKDPHLTTFNYSLTKDCAELAAIAGS